jgi:Membrane domain of glycerophosphoryl diester phosphodiesterase
LAGLREAFCGDILRRVPRRQVVLALTALAGVSLPSLAQAANAQRTLAERYAPVVRLVKQTRQCGHGEPYVPTNVDVLLSNPGVVLRGPWDKTNIIKVAPTGADLGRGLFDYHLDFPGSAVSPGCTYDEWSHRLNKGHAPAMYARVVTEAAHRAQLALQYWFFYVFNDFNDKHEGDWEMIQLDFDAPTVTQALSTKPTLIGYSQHEGAESAHWGDSKLEIVDGTHPVVYPALGSHANYYTSALHLGRSAAEGVGCDETTGPSSEVRPDAVLVPTQRAAYLRAYPWLGFEGHWGEEHEGFYNGPTGPTMKLQWSKPITWAHEGWRDKSFSVPAGSSVGTTATGFFCGGVATGSSLLTAIVGNPSPVFIALAVILLVLLWLISRTQWQPSAPLRLEHRRAWGSIINASRRMYFGHLRLFLAIGILFFPLGVVISAIQYLLFRVSGLNALVDSAGSTNAVVDFLAITLGLVLTIFGLAVVQSATALAMVEIDAGRNLGAWAAYKSVLPRIPSLLGGVFAAAALIAIVDLTAVGALLGTWLAVRWSLLPQVIVLEDASARAALRRSARLVRGSWWRVAALLFFVTVIALLLGPLCGTLLLFVSHASFDFINLVSGLIYSVVLPFAAIATTYLYFDLRVAKQHEGEPAEAADVLPADTPPAVLAPR